MTSVHSWLKTGGGLDSCLPDFEPRAAQLKMASEIETCLNTKTNLLCEAPTGTGKTYAYLIPLIISDKKALISTGTKTLQDQLYHRDLPNIQRLMKTSSRTALLKGRSNYLCLYRFEQQFKIGGSFEKTLLIQLTHVSNWAKTTQSGDISTCRTLPEDAPVWPYVTSTQDNCLKTECPNFSQCYLVKARKKASEAQMVVVNHHLLFADQSLKEEGFAQLLPDFEVVVLDEAHQVPEVAAHFFTETLSTRQLELLCQDIKNEVLAEAPDLEMLIDEADRVLQALENWLLTTTFVESKGSWHVFKSQVKFLEALTQLEAVMADFLEALSLTEGRTKGLASALVRAEALKSQFSTMTTLSPTRESIHWYEVFKRSFVIHQTPLSIASHFNKMLEDSNTQWLFTSATLTTDSHFQYFKESLGLNQETNEMVLESPFSFEKNALLYLPRGLPEPQSTDYTTACVKAVLPIIQANQGRCFFLFTSHKALNEAQEILELHLNYPLLVQGTQSRTELLESFVAKKNAVLLGTSSFWEGVDIRGEALSCVIIDKLPFVSPADPINQARCQAFKIKGDDPFLAYQLPKAVIMLKQGAGRLIRDGNDKGVFVVCDPRLVSKAYGGVFLASLPDFSRTRELDKVIEFCRNNN